MKVNPKVTEVVARLSMTAKGIVKKREPQSYNIAENERILSPKSNNSHSSFKNENTKQIPEHRDVRTS